MAETGKPHAELCRLTAEWALKPPGADWLALYEYQSFASQEFPDVLTYSPTGTRLYEIKISRSDFKADLKKESRISWVPPYHNFIRLNAEVVQLRKELNHKTRPTYVPERFDRYLKSLKIVEGSVGEWRKSYIQVPHLGGERYYVCEPGIILKDELPQGWGLIYYTGGKFKQIQNSGPWKADVRTERDIIAHAMRRYASGDHTGIIIRTY